MDDKQSLARLDKAKLAAGDLLDRRRILAQATDLLSKAAVLGLLESDLPGELFVLLSRANQRGQAAFADKRVNHHEADEDGNRREERTTATSAPAGVVVAVRAQPHGPRGSHQSTVVP